MAKAHPGDIYMTDCVEDITLLVCDNNLADSLLKRVKHYLDRANRNSKNRKRDAMEDLKRTGAYLALTENYFDEQGIIIPNNPYDIRQRRNYISLLRFNLEAGLGYLEIDLANRKPDEPKTTQIEQIEKGYLGVWGVYKRALNDYSSSTKYITELPLAV